MIYFFKRNEDITSEIYLMLSLMVLSEEENCGYKTNQHTKKKQLKKIRHQTKQPKTKQINCICLKLDECLDKTCN